MTEATAQSAAHDKPALPVERKSHALYRPESPAAVDLKRVKSQTAVLAGVSVDQVGFLESRQSVHPARLVFVIMVAYKELLKQERFSEAAPDADDLLSERMSLEWPWGRRPGHRTTNAPIRLEIERTLGSIYGMALRAAEGDAVRRIEIPLRNHEKNPMAAVIVDLLARMHEFFTKDATAARKIPFAIAWTGVTDEELVAVASRQEEESA